MFHNKNTIIFDMDGTLIDSIGMWNEVDSLLINEISNTNKIHELEFIQAQRDTILRECSKCKNPYSEYFQYIKDYYNSSKSLEEITKIRYNIAQKFLENTIDYKKDAEIFIKELKKRNFTLVIATTTKRTNIEIYRLKNKNIINKANIDDYFSYIYTREDVSEIKPNPEIYNKIMEELHTKPEQCLVLEDSLIGLEAAKNANIETIAIYDKYSDHEREAINLNSTYQAASYAQLIEALALCH